jgi:hypothetical protein
MADYLLDIEVSPHVKKYIVYHLSPNPFQLDFNKEVKLDKRSHIGVFILHLLKKQYHIQKKKERPIKYNNKKITDSIKISIANKPEQHIDPQYSFIGIDDLGVRRLDVFIDGMFRNELYLYLNSYQMIKGKIKEGLELFYKKYQLNDEDIPVETLLRDYRRYRKKNNLLIVK